MGRPLTEGAPLDAIHNYALFDGDMVSKQPKIKARIFCRLRFFLTHKKAMII
jgi:hypothetical protein